MESTLWRPLTLTRARGPHTHFEMTQKQPPSVQCVQEEGRSLLTPTLSFCRGWVSRSRVGRPPSLSLHSPQGPSSWDWGLADPWAPAGARSGGCTPAQMSDLGTCGQLPGRFPLAQG